MNTAVRENRNGERTKTEHFVAPVSSVVEDENAYTLRVEMPGVNKEGLEISVENNELTIFGRRSLPVIDGTLAHRETGALPGIALFAWRKGATKPYFIVTNLWRSNLRPKLWRSKLKRKMARTKS